MWISVIQSVKDLIICESASSNQWKTWLEQKGWGRGNSFCLPIWATTFDCFQPWDLNWNIGCFGVSRLLSGRNLHHGLSWISTLPVADLRTPVSMIVWAKSLWWISSLCRSLINTTTTIILFYGNCISLKGKFWHRHTQGECHVTVNAEMEMLL